MKLSVINNMKRRNVGIHVNEIRQNEGCALKITDNTNYVQQVRKPYNYSSK